MDTTRRGLVKLALALSVSLLAAAPTVWARTPVEPSELATVALGELPREAQHTYQLILRGGPFRYEKDGTVFFNRERLLPASPRGYYREYTVPTPGSRDRGARRWVCGGQVPVRPDHCYYTSDHYASFKRMVP